MTEAEWLDATSPDDLVHYLNQHGASARKFRLFSCACCRRVWHLMTSDQARHAVDTAERFADGLATVADLEHAESSLRTSISQSRSANAESSPTRAEEAAVKTTWLCGGKEGNAEGAGYVLLCIPDAVVTERFDNWTDAAAELHQQVEQQLCDLVRDIFGNPFRPVAFDPDWRTSTVVALATGIYAERAFDRLPILADALQDAGCDTNDLLTHLRGDGPHVKGCWALDLVLGKE